VDVRLLVMTNSLEPSSSFAGDPTPRTSWRWRFEDGSGAELTVAGGSTASGATGFPSQSDAESWIGEVWRDLLDEGVEQVTLFEGDREVYGPMSLHSAR
jgi:hypothetical protein